MRVRVSNRTDHDWRDMGPGHGQRHRWDHERRTIDEQLAAAFPHRRVTSLPTVVAPIQRAA